MRLFRCALLAAVFVTVLRAEDARQIGYVDCSPGDRQVLTPVFSNTCTSEVVARLRCGDEVEILAREGAWLNVAATEASEAYIGVASISQKKGHFVALDLPARFGPNIPGCAIARPRTGKVAALAIYSPNPQYTEKARRAKFEGGLLLP